MPAGQLRPVKELFDGLYDGPHATPKPSQTGPVFLGIKNVTEDGHLELSAVRHIAEEDYARWTKRVEPRAGDIVFTYEATLNRYAIIPDGFRGCLGRRMALVRTSPEKVNNRYLYYYFFSPEWRALIKTNILSGSTVDRIPLTRFPDFLVRERDLPTQNKIASVLGAYDDLIENNTKRMKKLESMVRLLYRHYFNTPEADDWEEMPIGKLISSHIGGGWGSDELTQNMTEPAYVIRGTDIPPVKTGDLATVPFRYHKPSNLSSRALKEGDIIFEVSGGSKGQPLGRSLFMTKELIARFDSSVMCASFCKRITLNPELLIPEILYLSLLDAYENGEIETYSVQSTGISNFKWTEYIERVTRKIPPVPIQKEFQSKAAPILSQISVLGKMNANLNHTRSLLLPKLMSGEIEV